MDDVMQLMQDRIDECNQRTQPTKKQGKFFSNGLIGYRMQAFGGETTAQTNGTKHSIEWQKKNNSVKFEADNHGDISLKYERKF